MENHGKFIDDLFKEELGNHTETPPPASWAALEKRLDRVPLRAPGQAYRRSMYVGVACLTAVLCLVVTKKMFFNAYADNRNAMTNNATNIKSNTTGTISKQNDNQLVNDKNEIADNDLSKAGNNSQQVNNNQTSPANKYGQNARSSAANKNNSNRKQASALALNSNGAVTSQSEGIAQQPENIYNSAGSGPSAREEANTGNKTTTPEKPNAQTPATTKKPAEIKKPIAAKQTPKTKPVFDRFELGIKAGYETGFNNDAAKKAVISPYIQYNITQRLSIMLQPSVKESFLNNIHIGNPKSYNKENADSGSVLDFTREVVPIEGEILYRTQFSYTQSHDSIVKSNTFGGTYTEYELPVLVKLGISKSFSVYGGVNIVYSKLTGVTEHTLSVNNIYVSRDSTVFTYPGQAIPRPPVSSVITYKGTDISNYTGPQYPTPTDGLIRVGYMVGFSYEYSKRWLFDALIQQANVNANTQAGYNINSTLSAPYVRFTLGYKILE